MRKQLASTETGFGKALEKQLEDHFIGESGSHLSFPRDHDSPITGHTYDNDIATQGIIASAALYHRAGLKYHVGLYTSSISVNNTNGPNFIQLASHTPGIPVTSNRLSKSLATFHPPLSSNDLESIERNFHEQIFQLRRKIAHAHLSTLKDDQLRASYAAHLGKNLPLQEKSLKTLERIEGDIQKSGIPLPNLLAQLHQGLDILNRAKSPRISGSFVDQCLTLQNHLITALLPPCINQVSLDFFQIARDLLIEALRNPETLTYKIFSKPQSFLSFVQHLSGTGMGWNNLGGGTYESPFVSIEKSGDGRVREFKYPLNHNLEDHTPDRIAQNLEERTLSPTGALLFAFLMMETGIGLHGGISQCQYAPHILRQLLVFLDHMGIQDRRAALQNMPCDIATQPLVFSSRRDGSLKRFSDFFQAPLQLENLVRIPDLSGRESLSLAAPTLDLCFKTYVDQKNTTPPHSQESRFFLSKTR